MRTLASILTSTLLSSLRSSQPHLFSPSEILPAILLPHPRLSCHTCVAVLASLEPRNLLRPRCSPASILLTLGWWSAAWAGTCPAAPRVRRFRDPLNGVLMEGQPGLLLTLRDRARRRKPRPSTLKGTVPRFIHAVHATCHPPRPPSLPHPLRRIHAYCDSCACRCRPRQHQRKDEFTAEV
ncbi:hypothetical protein E2C01_102595 [Portunus trituberculatus]|uniref:Uncharacterized protein n=1 Tax=Portunus trituberculatus TaxID=210409 RepID=A0A5B7KIW7_PORTR|nr:hypothetical protein [Portunus trituberculatus]